MVRVHPLTGTHWCREDDQELIAKIKEAEDLHDDDDEALNTRAQMDRDDSESEIWICDHSVFFDRSE